VKSQPSSRTDVEGVIREILASELGVDAALLSRCAADTPLLGRGIGLDSMEALALTTALEEHFVLHIDDEDLSAALFETVGTLADYITRQLETHSC
jgi:acyl carrier protein